MSAVSHRLVFLDPGGKPGAKFSLRESSCVIGRNSRVCDVRIQRDDVDPTHCQIELDENRQAWVSRLCGEQMVCRLNGRELSEKAKLTPGDSIQIGGRTVRYETPAVLSVPKRVDSFTPRRTPRKALAARQQQQQQLSTTTPLKPPTVGAVLSSTSPSSSSSTPKPTPGRTPSHTPRRRRAIPMAALPTNDEPAAASSSIDGSNAEPLQNATPSKQVVP